MKKNIISALLLASVATLSTACANIELSDEALDAMSESGPTESGKGLGSKAKSSSPADGLVVPRSEQPFGKSYEAWASAYWQWALSIPVAENPVAEGPCDMDQSGNVYFLAGNLGGLSERKCTVEQGKGIFIPLVNTVVRSCPEMATDTTGGPTCDDVASENGIREMATSTIDDANAQLTLLIDGYPVHDLEQFRARSDLFLDTSPKHPEDRLMPTCSGPIEANLCGVPEGDARIAITDGYFVMLRQLSDGPHEIRIAGRASSASVLPWFDITYHIFVTSTPPQGEY